MIPGIENASLAHIVKSPWLDKDLLQGMTNLTVRIVLVNFSQSVALPAPNQLQVRINYAQVSYNYRSPKVTVLPTLPISLQNWDFEPILKIKLVELATLQILTKIIVKNRHWWPQIHLLRGSPLA